MTGKTKAAMPGRQCNTALLKHRQITRLAAGGQTLHSPVLARSNYHQGFKIRAGVQNLRSPVWGCSNHDEAAASDLHNSIRVAQNLSRRNSHAQIKLGDMPSLNNRVRLTYGDRDKGEQYSGSWQNNVKRGLEAPTKNVESCEDNQPSLRGEPLHNSLIVAQNRPFLRGAVHSITGSNPVQLSDSDLAFLRWRRLISPCMAVTINWAVLSPCSLTCSIASTTSCGARVCNFCDFSFFVPVAITKSPDIKWSTEYQKKNEIKHLKWIPLCIYSGVHLKGVHLQDIAKPGSARTLTGPLTKPLVEVTVMAELQHTQTRPKYQYRFLALSAIGRNVIHITATTEREAREQSPAGCVMVFAGRLPVREGRHA
ncbi:host cell division inhibitor Icd-like protein [Salmonella enterica]|nr:host cell division inhibitor Icd-like protein [Salmonella enterica]